MLVVAVEFKIFAAHHDAFIRAISANADRTLNIEPGCKQFDVCLSCEQFDSIFLYELYDDRAAFEVHLASDHFAEFNTATAAWVERKSVKMFNRKYPIL